MSSILEAIAEDPGLYLMDLQGDDLRLQTMTREAFHRSIFLDERIVHGGRQGFRAPLDAVLDGYAGPPPAERPIALIFHVAQCGSTLLARALDLPGRDLVLREPAALRSLGVMARLESAEGADALGPRLRRLLPFVLSVLGKHWPDEASVVVKANVPVNFIAREILDLEPHAAAILLHFPLDSYVAAVMRTEGHERWVDTIFRELRLDSSPWAAASPPRDTAERAACLWFAQMKAFEPLPAEFSNVRSLSAGAFFDSPAETIAAAAGLFGLELEQGEAMHISSGELFATYSKNPALDYDPEVREAREAEARSRLASQIGEARTWALAARDRHGLCESLGSPLVGEAVPLLG